MCFVRRAIQAAGLLETEARELLRALLARLRTYYATRRVQGTGSCEYWPSEKVHRR